MASLGPGIQVVREVYYRVDLQDGQPHHTLTHSVSVNNDVGSVRPTLILNASPPNGPQGTLDSSNSGTNESVGATESPSTQPIGDDISQPMSPTAPVHRSISDIDIGSPNSPVLLEEADSATGTAKPRMPLPLEPVVEVVPSSTSPRLPAPPSHTSPDALHDAEGILRLVASVDIARKYIRLLSQLCMAFKGTESEVQERVLRIESCLKRISLQIDLIPKIASSLDPEHLQLNVEVVLILESKLKLSLSRLEKLSESMNQRSLLGRGVNAWKRSALKENLDRSISDLESWQQIFDPSWYLILAAAKPLGDVELVKQSGNSDGTEDSAQLLRSSLVSSPANRPSSVFLPDTVLDPRLTTDVTFSSAKIGHGPADSHDVSRAFVLEQFSCPSYGNPGEFQQQVRNMAMKLANVEPSKFGLLSCKGVIRYTPPGSDIPTAYTMVFSMPTGMEHPRSLRSLLIGGDKYHSLSERFKLASQLVKSVSFVHAHDFVHKNIRPESVLLFRDSDSSFGSSFLMGFEHIKMVDGVEDLVRDNEWQLNLYRHPQRQGIHVDYSYNMQHDVYSLGVCLLEIGLWQSFLTVDESGKSSPSEIITEPSKHDGGRELPETYALKRHLVSLARTELPRYMGTKYSEIVVTCLTCLDEDNVDFGDEDEFLDEDGILIGVRFIEKVIMKLNTIAV